MSAMLFSNPAADGPEQKRTAAVCVFFCCSVFFVSRRDASPFLCRLGETVSLSRVMGRVACRVSRVGSRDVFGAVCRVPCAGTDRGTYTELGDGWVAYAGRCCCRLLLLLSAGWFGWLAGLAGWLAVWRRHRNPKPCSLRLRCALAEAIAASAGAGVRAPRVRIARALTPVLGF